MQDNKSLGRKRKITDVGDGLSSSQSSSESDHTEEVGMCINPDVM